METTGWKVWTCLRETAVSYDHHKKAGNQGDVVKHVALLAALDTILRSFGKTDFRYADTFAGYAYSPLIKANEWAEGIGRLVEKGTQLERNPHTKLWYEWYLRGRPHLLGGVYPGSSLIVNDVCRSHAKQPSLALWDVSPAVIANLMETYHGQGHRIFTRPAKPQDRCVRDADFLFVDPPGASMIKRKGYPHWPRLTEFFEDHDKPILVWLPVILRRKKGKDGEPDQDIEDSKPQRDDALRRGFCATVVRWEAGIRTVGCQLIYRLPVNVENPIRRAVEHIVELCNCAKTLPTDVQAITHLP